MLLSKLVQQMDHTNGLFKFTISTLEFSKILIPICQVKVVLHCQKV